MKELRKEIEKLVENEDFVSYEEFIFELKEEKEEVREDEHRNTSRRICRSL